MAWRWQDGPSSSIPIIPDGIGLPTSTTPTARATIAGALSFAHKINMPGHWFAPPAIAAAYGQLGELGAATKALRDLLKLRPDFAATVRKQMEKWGPPEFLERMIDGWRKAGLEIADAERMADRSSFRETPASPAPK